MAAILAFFADFPFELFVIQTLNGIVTGMILALIASGLTLIFGIMDVVNFAHGELFMLGAYVGVIVLSTTGSFWLALILALPATVAAVRFGGISADFSHPPAWWHFPPALLLLALLPGFVLQGGLEEWIVRGYIYHTLRERWRPGLESGDWGAPFGIAP